MSNNQSKKSVCCKKCDYQTRIDKTVFFDCQNSACGCHSSQDLEGKCKCEATRFPGVVTTEYCPIHSKPVSEGKEKPMCNNCDETRIGMLVPCVFCKEQTCVGCSYRRPDDYICRWCKQKKLDVTPPSNALRSEEKVKHCVDPECEECGVFAYNKGRADERKKMGEMIKNADWNEIHLCGFNDGVKCDCLHSTLNAVLALLNEEKKK